MHGLSEIGGGLAQALMDRDSALDGLTRGLTLVQLKRTLRSLRTELLSSQDNFNDLRGSLRQLEDGIVGELTRIRGLY